MDRRRLRGDVVFGVAYMGLTLAIEVMLVVVVRLRIPRDNRIIAPVLLGIAPIAAAWITGRRRSREMAALAALTIVLTLVFTAVFGRLTGISTGIGPPIVIRSIAGTIAAVAVSVSARRG